MPIYIFYVRKRYGNRQLLGTYSVSGTESGEKQNPACQRVLWEQQCRPIKNKLLSTQENRISGLAGGQGRWCLVAQLGQVNLLVRDHPWEDRLTLCQRVRRSNFSFNEVRYFFHGISPQHSSLQSTHFPSLSTFLNYSEKGTFFSSF